MRNQTEGARKVKEFMKTVLVIPNYSCPVHVLQKKKINNYANKVLGNLKTILQANFSKSIC